MPKQLSESVAVPAAAKGAVVVSRSFPASATEKYSAISVPRRLTEIIRTLRWFIFKIV